MSNADMIKHLSAMLESSREELETLEARYNKLRAEVLTYESNLTKLQELEEGKFKEIVEEATTENTPAKDNKQLKEEIYQYFVQRPQLTQSPQGVTVFLINERDWPDEKGFKIRVSNLLRKIAREEPWLERKGHGKYQHAGS
ncbi:MAG: hypothetical protein CMH57_01475 [Myxococcales bacterium]|nr:hypothetical protein [Myxococcales bacterium]